MSERAFEIWMATDYTTEVNWYSRFNNEFTHRRAYVENDATIECKRIGKSSLPPLKR